MLDAMSPLRVLGRGYAMVRTESGDVVKCHTDVAPGDRIDITLQSGGIFARVEQTWEDEDGKRV